MIPPSASIFAQMTRRFCCRATHGLQPSVRRSMPLPRAARAGPCVFDLFVLGMERSEVSNWFPKTLARRCHAMQRARPSARNIHPSIQTRFCLLDPAQREQLQDGTPGSRVNCFVGDLIDQILAVPPESITERRRYRCLRRTDASSTRIHSADVIKTLEVRPSGRPSHFRLWQRKG